MSALLKRNERGFTPTHLQVWGFTLVEAVVSIIILGIAVSSMLGVLMIGRVSAVKAKHYMQAMNLLRLKMEDLKAALYDDIVSSTGSTSIDIGQDLVENTSDDLYGSLLVEVKDKNDIDQDNDVDEAEIDVDGDGINDPCKIIYVSLSWANPTWAGATDVSENLVTLITK